LKKVTILGSTGTIGCNTLELISNSDNFKVTTLTAGNNVDLLIKQALEFKPELAIIENDSLYNELKTALTGTNIRTASGKQAIAQAAAIPTDIVISGIVGAAALPPTLAAIRQGTKIGLANKECLVCAGDLFMDEVTKHNVEIIPIDSEHNSLFQVFEFDKKDSVEKITLTASGGSFRNFTKEQLANVTPTQAVKHPNWTMGAKISVDSSTMMNKGLEVIEAYHLFPVSVEQIDVVVHPESIIHGMVHYNDGSVKAGLSVPDMKIPISYALGFPNRMKNNTERLDLTKLGKLTFEQPDTNKFPALKLAYETLEMGGNAACILNAANEIAVDNFLSGKISFIDIINVVKDSLEKIENKNLNSIEEVFETDIKAREVALKAVRNINN